jgi:hypothetical protein
MLCLFEHCPLTLPFFLSWHLSLQSALECTHLHVAGVGSRAVARLCSEARASHHLREVCILCVGEFRPFFVFMRKKKIP